MCHISYLCHLFQSSQQPHEGGSSLTSIWQLEKEVLRSEFAQVHTRSGRERI